MAERPRSDKVKRLIGIYEEKDVNSKKEKESSEVTAISRRIGEKILCDPCKFGNTEEEADGFCKTCLEYLCARCVKKHVKEKLTKEHSLIRNHIPTKDAALLGRMKTMLFCNQHPDQTIAYHCEAHGEYTCYLCKKESHNGCVTTSLISAGQSASNGTRNIFKRLYTVRDKVRLLKDLKEKRIESLLHEKHQIQRQQQEYFQELTETVTENVNREKANTEELFETLLRDIRNQLKECEDIEGDGICRTEMIETAMQNCSGDNLALITKVIERKMDAIEENTARIEQEGNAHICFCRSDSLLNNLSVVTGTVTVVDNRGHTSLQDQVEITSDEVNEINLASVPPSADALHVSPRVQRRITMDYNIRLCDDFSACSVWGLVVFQDGRLVLIDNSNSKMKLITKHFNFVCAEPVQVGPTSMCYLGRDIVAVAFGKSKHIYIYFIGQQSIYLHDKFKTSGLFCRGLAFYSDNAVAAIVSNVDMGYITRVDDVVEVHFFHFRTKSCTKKIGYFESKGGRNLWFRDPIDISCADEAVMLIAETNIIHCFDLSTDTNGEDIAEQRWYYRLDDDDASHVTNDGKSAFVCEKRGRVRQIALDSYRYHRVIISNTEIPYSLSIDERRGLIIVGYKDKDSFEVMNFARSRHSGLVNIVS